MSKEYCPPVEVSVWRVSDKEDPLVFEEVEAKTAHQAWQKLMGKVGGKEYGFGFLHYEVLHPVKQRGPYATVIEEKEVTEESPISNETMRVHQRKKVYSKREVEAVCFYCFAVCKEDRYCYGCKHFVCSECDAQIDIMGPHKEYEHLSSAQATRYRKRNSKKKKLVKRFHKRKPI